MRLTCVSCGLGRATIYDFLLVTGSDATPRITAEIAALGTSKRCVDSFDDLVLRALGALLCAIRFRKPIAGFWRKICLRVGHL